MFRPRHVATQFLAREQSEGAGATVRRSIGSAKLRNLDPFLMLDEAYLSQPAGFPEHPHRGFETVSYVLPESKGRVLHEDFLGNKGELRAGDLQWMTAGRGIMHAEMPAGTEMTRGLQLWINLPRARKMVAPRYQEVQRESVPHVFNDAKDVEAIVFAGEVFGTKGPIETEAPVTYIHFILQAGARLEYPIPPTHNALVYMLGGSGMISGDRAIAAHEAVVMERDGDGVQLDASERDGLEVIAISGQPLNEPVVQYGPFVMSTQAEIREAFEDFQRMQNGFEHARGWSPTITEGQKVGTKFLQELSVGDAILIQHPTSLVEETRIVRMVLSDISAAISSAFSSDLVSSTAFHYIKAPRDDTLKDDDETSKKRTRKTDEAIAFGTYAGGTEVGSQFTYRVKKSGAYGGYAIVKENANVDRSREDLLDLRSKRKGDRHCM